MVGARVFPSRWAGFGGAYRYNFNQQDRGSFNNSQAFSGSVTVPCTNVGTQGLGNICTPTTVTTSFRGVPQGFAVSTDPNGYIFQAWIGRRNKRATDIVNQAPNINSVTLSQTRITIGCPPGQSFRIGLSDSRTINVATSASDPENDVFTYNYTVSADALSEAVPMFSGISRMRPREHILSQLVWMMVAVFAERPTLRL